MSGQGGHDLTLEQFDARAVVGRLREVVDLVTESARRHVAEALDQLLGGAHAEVALPVVLVEVVLRFRRADELALDSIREEIASTGPDEFIRIYEEARAARDG